MISACAQRVEKLVELDELFRRSPALLLLPDAHKSNGALSAAILMVLLTTFNFTSVDPTFHGQIPHVFPCNHFCNFRDVRPKSFCRVWEKSLRKMSHLNDTNYAVVIIVLKMHVLNISNI
ncbi:hypothetical protein NQD34_010933 [Periophthalmus magnuspinnatus]|nr:hypothetical protein NQD34_010933 [Periophthalmus magnuspinnatus]